MTITKTTVPLAGVAESCVRLVDKLNSLGAGIKRIFVCDSEFHSQTMNADTHLYTEDGTRQVPVCFVFWNPVTGEEIRQFYTPGAPYPPCPVSTGTDTLFVMFTAQAELMTMLVLWNVMPLRILDLDIEWRASNNEEYRLKEMKNEARSANKSDGEELSPMALLGVCALHGISTRGQQHKDEMRDLVLRGGPWTEDETAAILDYCAEDCYDTAALLSIYWPKIEDVFYGMSRQRIDGLKAALHRGRAMTGFAWMRHVGIPIDTELTSRLAKHFGRIMDILFEDVRVTFPVYNEDKYDIAPLRWKAFLTERGWLTNSQHPWPLTKGSAVVGADGKKTRARKNRQPRRDKETLEQMSLIYPELKQLTTITEIRSCTKLGLNFPYGPDNRHRTNFWPYGCITGRCVPSSSNYVLAGGSPAFRHLAKPGPGEILVEGDWSAQEVWIAAFLSGDKRMQKMLREADPYVEFGEMVGMIPRGTMKSYIAEHGGPGIKMCKKDFGEIRDRMKSVTLGVLYGKTAYTVARDCGITADEAAGLLRLHRVTFKQFWIWSEWLKNETLATRRIATKMGWPRQILRKKDREIHQAEEDRWKDIGNSLQNWPMQSHGSEMLRLALIYAAEMRVGVCGSLHDGIFAVGKIEDEATLLRDLKACMDRASIDLLGAATPIEFSVTRWPDRFVPEKKSHAIVVWNKMLVALETAEHEALNPAPPVPREPTFCKFKYEIGDIEIPDDPSTPPSHQPDDVCGVETTDGCKMCEEHCKNPDKCELHKTVLQGYYTEV